jgi:uncharacterized protein
LRPVLGVLDAVPAPRRVPLRMCVVCRGFRGKPEMVSMKRSATHRVVLAEGVHRSGRGLYVCKDVGCVKRMLTDKRLRRSYLEAMEEECVEHLRSLLVCMGQAEQVARSSGEGGP